VPARRPPERRGAFRTAREPTSGERRAGPSGAAGSAFRSPTSSLVSRSERDGFFYGPRARFSSSCPEKARQLRVDVYEAEAAPDDGSPFGKVRHIWRYRWNAWLGIGEFLPVF